MSAMAATAASLEQPLVPVAESEAMRRLLEAADDVAATPTTVLLLGESGTGKELVARYLHARSGRPGPWVAVNCAALPAELLESELFGHERGAFTGATERRAGRFEQAHGGTLLLDEISELPLSLQAKLLRALQEREIDRVGGQKPVPVDVRVVATSNRDLGEMVRRGHFRADLFYRLDVFPLTVPALRERPEDLPALALALLGEAAATMGREAPPLSAAALEALRRHSFPGNVRELRNLVERALVRSRGRAVEPSHLGLAPADRTPEAAPSSLELPLDLATLERMAIAEALRRVNGNRTHAARLLGIGLRTLRNKLRAARDAGAPLEAAEPAAGQGLPVPLPFNPAAARAPFQARPSQARASGDRA
ncbi:MAG: sigma 54-interacting transcriptional regulator [Deltaproteobacteria bacterium]|nr:sigma 54-interacting transcriptional regulator [Deltaproteobacteria bacterium]